MHLHSEIVNLVGRVVSISLVTLLIPRQQDCKLPTTVFDSVGEIPSARRANCEAATARRSEEGIETSRRNDSQISPNLEGAVVPALQGWIEMAGVFCAPKRR